MESPFRVVEAGSLIRFFPRGPEEDPVVGIVLGQWPTDGSLRVYTFHFEAAALVHAVPLASVEILFDPVSFRAICDRLLAAGSAKLNPSPEPRSVPAGSGAPGHPA